MRAGIYWLASYPKSGNTWMRSFIANLNHEEETPLDINEFHTGTISSARGWMDEVLGFDTAELSHDEIDKLRPDFYRWTSNEMEEDGYHKCHDAYTFLADGEPIFPVDATKGVVYILRNPLDVAISFANHCSIDIDKSIKHMGKKGFTFCAPEKAMARQIRQMLLSWSGHVMSWTDAPNLNRLVVRYEDMRLDPLATFTRVADFLQLSSDEKSIRQAVENCDFDVLQKQEQTGNFKERPQKSESFFRKGKVGDWRDTLTSSQVDQIIADHAEVMRRFGYLDKNGQPLHPPGTILNEGNRR